MTRSPYTEEQIIGILKQHQAGLGAKELCRKHGISDTTFCKWRSKFGGMDMSDEPTPTEFAAQPIEGHNQNRLSL